MNYRKFSLTFLGTAVDKFLRLYTGYRFLIEKNGRGIVNGKTASQSGSNSSSFRRAIDFLKKYMIPWGCSLLIMKNLSGWVPSWFTKHHVYMTIKRDLKTGCIEKIPKYDQPYLRLTTRGEKRLIHDFPLLKLRKRKWERKLRIVFFDIEETSHKARDQLRRKLKGLGLAQFQQSVYITPHDFAEDGGKFLESHGLGESVYLVVSRELLTGDEKVLAQKPWNLKK